MTGSEKFTYEFPEMSPRERLRELILYIAEKLKDDPNFGRTKLAKVIYFSDFRSYTMHGRPVSGSRYIRLPHGPVPNDYNSIMIEMETNGLVETISSDVHNYVQKRPVALRKADLSSFSAQEIDVVNQVIDELIHLNASEPSNRTHGIAWRLSEGQHYIPYEYALYSDEPLTEDETARAQELALKYRDCDFA